MPLETLNFRSGINAQNTPTGNQGAWSASTLVRFKNGSAKKFKGWVSLASSAVAGVPRALLSWLQINGTINIAAGTSATLNIWQYLTPVLASNSFVDVTPIIRTVTLTNAFTTAMGLNTVLVTDAGLTSPAPSYVVFSGATAINGITLSGKYAVMFPGATTYTVNAGTPATGTGTGGGTATAKYLIPSIPVDASLIYGTQVGDWALANWGQDLLASQHLGALYVWLASGGTSTRAVVVTNGTPAIGPPLTIGSMLIGTPERHLILLGCSDLNATTNYDPMLVRFSDVENYTSWQATAINSAGSYRFQGGTRLICGLVAPQQILIWSDTSLFSMRFIGAPYYYAFDTLAAGCGIIGPHAMAQHAGIVYWMGNNSFYRYRGGEPEEIPCLVWDKIFPNMNKLQASKVYCGVIAESSEIIWFWPGDNGTATENSQYVIYNYEDQVFYYADPAGQLQRNCWIDRDTYNFPVAMDSFGQLYQQETGSDAAGVAMYSSIRSGDFALAQGDSRTFLEYIIPDFEVATLVGNVSLVVHKTDYPVSGIYTDFGPYTMNSTTPKVTIRKRGRAFSFEFISNDLGANFQLGSCRVMITQDGKGPG